MSGEVELYGPGEIEQRDPKAATTQVTYQSPRWPMVPEWDAHQALRYAYLSNVWVWRCANANANAIKKLPLLSVSPSGRETPNSPLGKFLRAPNPNLSLRRLIANALVGYQVCGRFAWELETNARGIPIAAWPLAQSLLQVFATDGGAQYFSGFAYGRPGEEVELKPDQVLYIWRPSQSDPRQPESVLQAARLDVSIAVMQDRYEFAFLNNDARPATMVVHQQFAKKEQRSAFRQQFQAEFRGPDQAGKTLFAEAADDPTKAIQIQTVGSTQRDGQFSERMEQKIRNILVAFGTPMSVLGDASKRTFSNADKEKEVWWTETLEEMVTDLESDLNLHLAPRFGSDLVKIDLSGVPELQSSRKLIMAAKPEAMYASGIITLNESRAALGLPPVAGGDELPEAPAVEPVETPAEPADDTADDQRALPAASAELPAELRSSVDTHTHRLEPTEVVDDDAEERALKLWQATDNAARVLERTWLRAFSRLFERQADATLSRLTGKRGRQWLTKATAPDVREVPPTDGIFDYQHWYRETIAEATQLYEVVVQTSAGNVAARFGVDFDLDAPWVDSTIRRRANRLAGQVTQTTYRRIQREMALGAQAGETIEEIALRIRKVFDVASKSRAVTIARTEVISAYNGAALDMAATLGPDVAAAKQWIPTPYGDYRDWHLNLDPKVMPVTEAWSVDGARMMNPGDPSGGAKNVINCRCAVAFLSPDEYATWQASAGRSAPLRAVRALVSMVTPGAEFNAARFERALVEVA